MDRGQAFEELEAGFTNKNLIKHSFAVEAIVRDLAVYFREDTERCGL